MRLGRAPMTTGKTDTGLLFLLIFVVTVVVLAVSFAAVGAVRALGADHDADYWLGVERLSWLVTIFLLIGGILALIQLWQIGREGFAAALVHHEQVGEGAADIDPEPI